MRKLIRFPCESAFLSGSFDEGERSVGLLCVTGGSQVRGGPHRMLHQLASAAAGEGFPAFRFERRGVGDSDGEDPGYRDSGRDLAAAVAAFRAEKPDLRTIVGFGLCDGATTLALHGRAASVDVIVLANPWLIEFEAGAVAPAAARAHYRRRFFSPAAWWAVLRGRVNVFGTIKSLFGSVAAKTDVSLADEVAERLADYSGKLTLILSRGDNTAIAARACWEGPVFARFQGEHVVTIDSDSHTFARTGDLALVQTIILNLLRGANDDD